MERINELLAKLSELTADELAELRTLIAAEAEQLEQAATTPESVEALTALADAAEKLQGEDDRRGQEQAKLEEQREAALAKLRPPADSTQPDEDDPEGDTEDGDDGQDDAGGAPAPADPQPADQPTAVAASGRRPRVPTQRPPLERISARTRPPAPQGPARPVVRTTVSDAATGNVLKTRRDVVTLMADALDRGSRHDRRVIQALTEYPTERKLLRGEQPENDALVAAALPLESLTPDAIVAAGGLCAPVQNIYDVNVIGSTARPVREGLPSFGADRGGISLRPGVVFDDWAGAVSDWTLQNDIDAATAGSPDPTKAIIEALCPGFTAYYVEATVARVRFRNVTSRFDPEGTDANMRAVDVAFARKAENKLLSKMAALSLVLTESKRLGTVRDALVAFDKLQAQMRSRWRYDDSVMLAAFAPAWFRDMLRADITRGETTLDALAVADARIASWFSERGVNIRWHLDGRATAQVAGGGAPAIAAQQYAALTSGGAIPGFPAQVEFLIYREGDFLRLDGGEINLGTVRDTTTNAVNAYEIFKEEFEGVAFRGTAGTAVQLVASFEPTGMSAGRKDTDSLTD
jgi:hypothetical protein